MNFDKLYKTITEALPLSVAKTYSKGWDKSRFKDWFPKGKYRVYLDLDDDISVESNGKILYNKINAAMTGIGFKIDDYEKGTVLDKHGRSTTVARVLNRMKNMTPTEINNLINDFQDDSNRMFINTSADDFKVVVSRHPYDIAGMSTDREWLSCKRLATNKDFTQFGEYSYMLKDEVNLMMIAYLVKADDLNIKKPVARVNIVPYVDDEGLIAFKVGSRVYSRYNQGNMSDETNDMRTMLMITVQKWIDEQQEDMSPFIGGIHPGIYQGDEGGSDELIAGDYGMFKNDIEEITYDPSKINDEEYEHIKDNPKAMRYLMNQNSQLFKYVDNPSEDLIEIVSRINPDMLGDINAYPPKIQMNMLKVNNKMYRRVKNKAVLFEEFPDSIRYSSDGDEEVQMKAIDSDIKYLAWLHDPTVEVVKHAIERYPDRKVDVLGQIARNIQRGNADKNTYSTLLAFANDRDMFKAIDMVGQLGIDKEFEDMLVKANPEYVQYISYPSKDSQVKYLHHCAMTKQYDKMNKIHASTDLVASAVRRGSSYLKYMAYDLADVVEELREKSIEPSAKAFKDMYVANDRKLYLFTVNPKLFVEMVRKHKTYQLNYQMFAQLYDEFDRWDIQRTLNADSKYEFRKSKDGKIELYDESKLPIVDEGEIENGKPTSAMLMQWWFAAFAEYVSNPENPWFKPNGRFYDVVERINSFHEKNVIRKPN